MYSSVYENEESVFCSSGVYSALVNPGPDLVVCDEGHRIKNAHAGISQSLKNIKTKYVIV